MCSSGLSGHVFPGLEPLLGTLSIGSLEVSLASCRPDVEQ